MSARKDWKKRVREQQLLAEKRNAARRKWWDSLTWTEQQEYIARKVLVQKEQHGQGEA